MAEHVVQVVDKAYFYDDNSDDDSLDIVDAIGNTMWSSRSDGTSFLEHEGKFRQAMWSAFEGCCFPKSGDWVLAIDADELLSSTGTNCCLRCELDKVIELAEKQGAKSVLLPVPEVFALDDDGTPLVRKDGLWGTIAGTRLFRYEKNGVYRDKAMGCGAEPTYVAQSKISRQSLGLHLMHFGYADKADQLAKFTRYTSLQSHGHLDAHVTSIVTTPTLERWVGPKVALKRGSK
jgi:hypothetical protein